jgi:hypothetical protein
VQVFPAGEGVFSFDATVLPRPTQMGGQYGRDSKILSGNGFHSRDYRDLSSRAGLSLGTDETIGQSTNQARLFARHARGSC